MKMTTKMVATLVARTTGDGLVSVKDHIVLGQEYIILSPPKVLPWRHLPSGRIIPRVSVQCTPERDGVEQWLPLELLKVPVEQVPALTSLLLDMIRR